ncbi:MAG: transposase domain-containing protein [Thermodesulfobacteriota bacterium]
MGLMWLSAEYPKLWTSKPLQYHKKYLYLLWDIVIEAWSGVLYKGGCKGSWAINRGKEDLRQLQQLNQGRLLYTKYNPLFCLDNGEGGLRARANAAIYSLMERAMAKSLEPCQYLRYLFENLPRAKTTADLKALL